MKKFPMVVFIIGSFLVGDRAAAKVSVLHKLIVFGDSLSDTGNSRIVTEAYGQTRIPQATPACCGRPGWFSILMPTSFSYDMGRCSNGPVAPEYRWEAFNQGSLGPQASLIGGTNSAITGSTTGLENFNSISPGVLSDFQPAYDQLGASWPCQEFVCAAPGFDPATSLFMVWLFPNDLLYWFSSGFMAPGTVIGAGGTIGSVSSLITNGIDNIATTIGTLASFAATQILVPNMPDLSLTTLFLEAPEVLQARAA